MAAVEVMDTVVEDNMTRLEQITEEIMEVSVIHRIMRDMFDRSLECLQDEHLTEDERTHYENMMKFAERRREETRKDLDALHLEQEVSTDFYERLRQTNESIKSIKARLTLYYIRMQDSTLTEDERHLYTRIVAYQEETLRHYQQMLVELEEERVEHEVDLIDVD